jgi:transposase
MPPQLSDQDRYKIVHFSIDLHLSQNQIAKKVGCVQSAVQRTLQRYRETGEVTDRRRSGRPSLLNSTSLKRLNNIIRTHPSATSTSLATAMTANTGQRISPRTIRRARTHSLGFHPVHEIITHSLTQGNIDKRLSFANTHLNSNYHHILFSDEKQFVLQNTGQVVWIKKGEAIPTREVDQMKASVMTWGCVWYGGKSTLHTTNKTINAQEYTSILSKHLLPCMPEGSRFRFQQDNASPHKAKHTTEWLAEFGVSVLPDWPPYSPELNPIEHVWSWMAAFVNGEGPTNRAQLEKAIHLAWQEIPQSTIKSYIEHLPTVCRQIIDAGGDHI